MYGNKGIAHKYAWALRRALQLSPMQDLLRKLKKRGVSLHQMDALELFGADGLRHTVDYYRSVHSLEIWELNEEYLPGLQKHFPNAQIKIVDTFEEIQSTSNTYNLFVSDEPGQIYGQTMEHSEHFDLMSKYLFRVARDAALIIVNAVPEPLKQMPTANQHVAYPEYLERRRQFYETNHPERVELEEMIPGYQRVIGSNGFKLDWHISVRRTLRSELSYLALAVSRI
jgi:hypothetical protein